SRLQVIALIAEQRVASSCSDCGGEDVARERFPGLASEPLAVRRLAPEHEDEPLGAGFCVASEVVAQALGRLERPLDRPAHEVRALQARGVAAEVGAVLVEQVVACAYGGRSLLRRHLGIVAERDRRVAALGREAETTFPVPGDEKRRARVLYRRRNKRRVA